MSNQVDEMTDRLLEDAGIGPGMRVLVIGRGRIVFCAWARKPG